MVIGTYYVKVGVKYQAAFPKKFRDILGDNIIITKGLDAHLLIVSENQWHNLLEGTEGKPFINKDTRALQRFLLGNASEVSMDSQGRFVIPEYLREYAHIASEIVFIGVGRFVELWDKRKWEENQKNISLDIPSIADRVSKNHE